MRRVAVRAMKQDDIAAILAINAAGWPGVAPLTLHETDTMLAGITRCWVADGADGISGYLIAYAASDVYDGEEFAWFRRQCAAFLYIDQVAIAPKSRHAGIGSQLYRVAAEHALTHSLNILTCEVNTDPPNPISLRFHRALGFQSVGALRTQDERTVLLLRLDLSI